MRASDSDRQRAIDELGRHLAAGRLDAEEYAARVEAAAGADELAELDALLADLPMVRIAVPRGGHRRAPGPERSTARWRARLIILASMLVLVAGIVLVLVAQWLAVGALAAAWLIGVLQGRLLSRR